MSNWKTYTAAVVCISVKWIAACQHDNGTRTRTMLESVNIKCDPLETKVNIDVEKGSIG